MFGKKQSNEACQEFSVTTVIERLGAGGAYFLLGDIIPKEIVEAFVFKDWKSVFTAAFYAKDEDTRECAFAKLKEKAVTLEELVFVYICEKDEKVAATYWNRMFEKAIPMDWLNIYAESFHCGHYIILARVAAIEEMAKSNIIAAVTKKA